MVKGTVMNRVIKYFSPNRKAQNSTIMFVLHRSIITKIIYCFLSNVSSTHIWILFHFLVFLLKKGLVFTIKPYRIHESPVAHDYFLYSPFSINTSQQSICGLYFLFGCITTDSKDLKYWYVLIIIVSFNISYYFFLHFWSEIYS